MRGRGFTSFFLGGGDYCDEQTTATLGVSTWEGICVVTDIG